MPPGGGALLCAVDRSLPAHVLCVVAPPGGPPRGMTSETVRSVARASLGLRGAARDSGRRWCGEGAFRSGMWFGSGWSRSVGLRAAAEAEGSWPSASNDVRCGHVIRTPAVTPTHSSYSCPVVPSSCPSACNPPPPTPPLLLPFNSPFLASPCPPPPLPRPELEYFFGNSAPPPPPPWTPPPRPE